MLQSLRIRNLALLEEVELDFETGFTAVTGETGAGKSILLGALSLLAGARADKSVIRQGAAATEVEAALFFTDSRKLDGQLAALDLPPCDDGVLILKRTLPRDKAPRISVNGSMATLNALQELGEQWIDFHGPGEPRRLLKEGCQRELLDLLAKNGAVLEKYQNHYLRWRQLVEEHEVLLQQATEMQRGDEFYDSRSRKMMATQAIYTMTDRHESTQSLRSREVERMLKPPAEEQKPGVTPIAITWREQTMPISGELVRMGRAPQNEIILEAKNVSRFHCQIKRENGRLLIEDLGSTNGTYVNEVRITEPHMLSVGDIVRVGHEQIIFHDHE